MKPKAKILIGVLLIIGGIYWYALGPLGFTGVTNLQALVISVQGALGVIVFLVGLFVVWIESDEMQIQRELERQDFEPQDFQEEGEEFGGEDETEVVIDEDVAYEEIVEGTVDEVKDEVRNQDLDPVKVLEAEKEGKERKTLTSWLEKRVK